ncbi:MAG: PorV/PorQ family protein [candidate division Zixibacteria bacterium]|nr:PorV/PorQ family protein [candidate division Zixibacteria bacterium]
MKYKIVVLIMVLLVVSLNLAYAGNDRRIGTAGAQELRIPIGARSTAMGGAVIADVSGVEAVYWNPAGLASLNGTEAMFSHQPYFAAIDVNFVGVATRIEDFGTIAVSAKIVNIGDMEETTVLQPDGTGRVFSPTFSVLTLSYARILTANVSLGLNAMFINEQIFEASASGMAFDVGILYDPNWNGLTMGMVIKNYGPEMEFSGRGFDRSDGSRPVSGTSASFDLPSSLNMGISYRFLDQDKNMASFSGNYRSNNYSLDLWQFGGEYVYDDVFSLRGGYNYSTQEDYMYGLTLGGGLKYGFGSSTLSIEYTWMETDDVFDANQFFTVKAMF